MDPFRSRQENLRAWCRQQGLEAAALADFEGIRNPSLRYLTAHPSDGLFILLRDGPAVLVPWDLNLAEQRSEVDILLPYTDFQRSLAEAIPGVLRRQGLKAGGRVEISGRFPHPLVQEIAAALDPIESICRYQGLDDFLLERRAVKDEQEISVLRSACALTDRIAGGLHDLLAASRDGIPELELALFIEAEARRMGAEGTGFESLVASPSRSFAIHPHPSFTRELAGTPGLSIIDFGIRMEGYTSDITLTVARGRLAERQEAMIRTVRELYRLAISWAEPGVFPEALGERIAEEVRKRGCTMPHSLGHGIGLEAHEKPLFRSGARSARSASETPLSPGMVFTIEPGLYDPEMGGVRLENDFLFTEEGLEPLTHADLIRLDEIS